jgi:hypothetical protein
MKIPITLIAQIVVFCYPCYAATDYSRELEKLTQERNQAVEAAERRFKAGLEPLLRRATCRSSRWWSAPPM